MVGMMQIMIYLLSIYLVFKGIEIFQIALVSDPARPARTAGIVIGIVLISAAVAVGVLAIVAEESMAAQIGNSMNNLPKIR